MAISTHCPNCKTAQEAPDDAAGKMTQCTKCGGQFMVVVPAKKICTRCGKDVSHAKRSKDQFGNYYCEDCILAVRQAERTAAQAVPPARPASQPAATDAEKDDLALSEYSPAAQGEAEPPPPAAPPEPGEDHGLPGQVVFRPLKSIQWPQRCVGCFAENPQQTMQLGVAPATEPGSGTKMGRLKGILFGLTMRLKKSGGQETGHYSLPICDNCCGKLSTKDVAGLAGQTDDVQPPPYHVLTPLLTREIELRCVVLRFSCQEYAGAFRKANEALVFNSLEACVADSEKQPEQLPPPPAAAPAQETAGVPAKAPDQAPAEAPEEPPASAPESTPPALPALELQPQPAPSAAAKVRAPAKPSGRPAGGDAASSETAVLRRPPGTSPQLAESDMTPPALPAVVFRDDAFGLEEPQKQETVPPPAPSQPLPSPAPKPAPKPVPPAPKPAPPVPKPAPPVPKPVPPAPEPALPAPKPAPTAPKPAPPAPKAMSPTPKPVPAALELVSPAREPGPPAPKPAPPAPKRMPPAPKAAPPAPKPPPSVPEPLPLEPEPPPPMPKPVPPAPRPPPPAPRAVPRAPKPAPPAPKLVPRPAPKPVPPPPQPAPPVAPRAAPVEEQILELLQSQPPTDGLHVTPEITPETLVAVTRACLVPNSECVLALVDCTATGSAENALVFGCMGVYYRNAQGSRSTGSGAIAYTEFPRRVFSDAKAGEVALDNDEFLNVSVCPLGAEKVLALLQGAKECARKAFPPPAPPSPLPPPPPQPLPPESSMSRDDLRQLARMHLPEGPVKALGAAAWEAEGTLGAKLGSLLGGKSAPPPPKEYRGGLIAVMADKLLIVELGKVPNTNITLAALKEMGPPKVSSYRLRGLTVECSESDTEGVLELQGAIAMKAIFPASCSKDNPSRAGDIAMAIRCA